MNERALWQLSVYNYCGFELQYLLTPSDGCGKRGGVEEKLISVFPLEGKIGAQNKSVSELIFSPGSQLTLKKCELLLKVCTVHVHDCN